MPIELTAETLIPLSPQERKNLIIHHASSIDSNISDKKLNKAYKYGQIISSIAPAYFQYQLEQNNKKLDCMSKLINKKTQKFADDFINWLKTDFEKKSKMLEDHPNPQNIFELCGAKFLVTSNSVTRSLSTKMGRLWEEIADISPYVIVPEFEFNIKIKGIDIILFSKNKYYFGQLKTSKGTLTGSQKDRTKKELALHENSIFISAFDLGNWTFNDQKIPRVAGKEFWNKTQIDYYLIESSVRKILQRIDNAFSELTMQ